MMINVKIFNINLFSLFLLFKAFITVFRFIILSTKGNKEVVFNDKGYSLNIV